MRKSRHSTIMLLVLLAVFIVVVVSSSSISRQLAFGTKFGRKLPEAFVLASRKESLLSASSWIHVPRGGGVGVDQDDEDEEEEEDDDDEEDVGATDIEDNDEKSDGEADESEEKEASESFLKDEKVKDDESDDEDVSSSPEKSSAVSGPPVPIVLKTGNSPLLDQTIELTMNRSRNIASLKQAASRQLPGRPPVSTIQIVYAGKILPDDMLLDELVEEEDDDEEEDDEMRNEDEAKLVLQLDMIPPVDPTYYKTLQQRLPDMTTSEILEAYATNEASLYQNTAVLIQEQTNLKSNDEDDEELSPSSISSDTLVSLQLKQYKDSIEQDLLTKLLTSNEAKNILADNLSPSARLGAMTTEVRGHRIRNMAAAGLKTSIKRSIQTQFNVSWPDLIRNILLFLFFGYFGGRTASARAILLLGAPMTVLIQLRSIKQILKCVMYAVLDHPAGIFLSLLPAPQQTILSMNVEKALQNVYGDRIKRLYGSKGAVLDDMDEEPSPSLAVLQGEASPSLDETARSDSEDDVSDEEDEDEEDYW